MLNAVAFGDIVKDLALDWAEGKISDEQFVKLVTRRCTVLVLQSLAAGLPGGVFASMAIEHACNELFALTDVMDASLDTASNRRNLVSKIKSEALDEMNRQRSLMEKYFAEEKFQWDKNIRDGFELISSGTHSNDVEIIAQGLEKFCSTSADELPLTIAKNSAEIFVAKKLL